MARDVTDRELLERQLRETHRAHAVGEVASGVSHDFRNLLAIVQGQVDLARVARAEGRFPAEELDEIGHATDRGVELVRKLLTLGASEDLERAPSSLADLVRDLRPALRAILPESIVLDLRIPADDAMVAMVDRGSIEQVIVNLATNARDALPGGGTVTVELDRVEAIEAGATDVVVGVGTLPPGEKSIRLRVHDDGEGMEPRTLRRIFEAFFTTKPGERGTGLGMPMVARMARLNGGVVTVSSQPGRGTTVSLFLSSSLADVEPDPKAEAPEEGLPRGQDQRVLVVEDEAALLRVLVSALQRLGYQAIPARNGDEAVRMLADRGTDFDLVLTDLVMPGRGGKEIFETMGVLGLRDVPVIFMSGYTAPEVVGALPIRGETLFLEKPWTLRQLTGTIAAALEASGPDSSTT